MKFFITKTVDAKNIAEAIKKDKTTDPCTIETITEVNENKNYGFKGK